MLVLFFLSIEEDMSSGMFQIEKAANAFVHEIIRETKNKKKSVKASNLRCNEKLSELNLYAL